MEAHPKILKVDHRIWWSIFLLVEVFLVAVMIGTVANQKWVELDPHPDPFNLAFKGSLIKLTDGLSAVYNIDNPTNPFDVSLYNYLRISCGVCFLRDQTTETPANSVVWVIYHGWCLLFQKIWFAAGLVIVFEVLALLSILVIGVVIILFWTQKHYYFRAAYLANGCLCASHYIAIIGWIAVSNVTFDDNCHDVVQGTDSNPIICAKDGPKLGLFMVIFLPFFVFPFYIIACLFQKKRANSVEAKDQLKKVTISEQNITSGIIDN